MGQAASDSACKEDRDCETVSYRSRSSVTSLTSSAVDTVRNYLRRVGRFILPSRCVVFLTFHQLIIFIFKSKFYYARNRTFIVGNAESS